jgi:hypothetical protein
MKTKQFFMRKKLIKRRFLSAMVSVMLTTVCIFLFCGCENPVIYSQYKVILPEIPTDWQTILGSPLWRIEWVDINGKWRKIDAQKSRNFQLEICNTKINPVIAYPYWPEKDFHPGMFYPAGALFPLDVSGDLITLDWQGGIDAQLYLYLSGYNNGENRKPEQFDWQRFRSLLRKETENADVKANPWNVDWESAAEKIARSGFRSSYITSRKYTEINVTIPENGLWISPSPFEEAKNWQSGENVVLQATESPSRYVSEKGTIIFDNKTWDYFPKDLEE